MADAYRSTDYQSAARLTDDFGGNTFRRPGLSTQEQILIEQRVTNDAKSPVVAYLLWFFLGGFGAHRFYLGRSGSGAAQLILTIIGAVTLFFIVGAFILLANGIWILVDAFLIPGMVQDDKERVRHRMMMMTLGSA